MSGGGRQRRDGSSKRVQLTSGDHGGPKDKKTKGRRSKSQAARAAGLREVERFRESIRAAEQRRAARRETTPTGAPAGTGHQPAGQGNGVDAYATVQVHLMGAVTLLSG
ncbi:hypothetical protein [Streptomyces sp. NPDC054834]